MPSSIRSKHSRARVGGGVLVMAALVVACFAPGAQAGLGYGRTGHGLSQAQRHEHRNIFSILQQRQQRAPPSQQPYALMMIKTDDQSAPPPSPPTPVPNSRRCAGHTDCANAEYCRRGTGGPSVCSACIDYRNYRCDDWQDSIDALCTVCDGATTNPPRPQQAPNRGQPPHHHEQYQHSQQKVRNHDREAYHHEQQHYHEQYQHSQQQDRSYERGANHHEQQYDHHSHSDQAQRENLRSGWRRGGDNGARSFVNNLCWGCFKASLFIFGTHCFIWLLCFVSTSIMWAIDSLTSGARRDTGGAGCCIRRLGRLVMLPVFMMSLCCPLFMFISAAFLFSSCYGCGCDGSGYRYSSPCSASRRFDCGSRGPRFRCSGTTAHAEETQQQQSKAEEASHRTSAAAAPRAGPTATMEPLLQEVVGNDETDEEGVYMQCAIAASLSQQSASSSESEHEPEPEPEPKKEHDTHTENVDPAKVKDQKTEQEGEGGCVAAGFVEVVMDSDE